MAREHARLWLDINDDEDFAKLSFDAQGFYTRVVLTEPTLNYCGVADWRPNRLTTRARDLTVPRILAAAAELEAANYLLFDLDTEEVLARSFIRRDELLRNPKMAATVIKAYPAIASTTLRQAVITEIQRVRSEHPEYSSWTHKDTADGLARLLSKSPMPEAGYSAQISVPKAVENTYPIPVRNGYPNPVENTYSNSVQNGVLGSGPDNRSVSVANPSTSTLHPSPAPLGGYVSAEGHQGADLDPNSPPPRFCENHPGGTSDPCLPCKVARQERDRWDLAQTVEAQRDAQADARQSAIAAAIAAAECELCDDDGYRSGVVCDHVDRTESNARGIAAVRAELAKTSAKGHA